MSHSAAPDPHRLLQLAYRTASRIVHNRLLAEEAGERAVHRLQLATLAGQPPHHPEAWIRVVAARSACAILRNGWAHVRPIDDDDFTDDEAPAAVRPGRDEMRRLCAATLTARQLEALDAALSHRTMRAAADSCGMAPRDFRRYLAAIAQHARACLQPPMAAPAAARWWPAPDAG